MGVSITLIQNTIIILFLIFNCIYFNGMPDFNVYMALLSQPSVYNNLVFSHNHNSSPMS